MAANTSTYCSFILILFPLWFILLYFLSVLCELLKILFFCAHILVNKADFDSDKLSGHADFSFLEELAAIHTTKTTNMCFNDHCITVLYWPECNPIESLNSFDYLEDKRQKKTMETS